MLCRLAKHSSFAKIPSLAPLPGRRRLYDSQRPTSPHAIRRKDGTSRRTTKSSRRGVECWHLGLPPPASSYHIYFSSFPRANINTDALRGKLVKSSDLQVGFLKNGRTERCTMVSAVTNTCAELSSQAFVQRAIVNEHTSGARKHTASTLQELT